MDCDIYPYHGSKRSLTRLNWLLSQSVNFIFITDVFSKELQRLKNCKHIKTSKTQHGFLGESLGHFCCGAGCGLAVRRQGWLCLGVTLGIDHPRGDGTTWPRASFLVRVPIRCQAGPKQPASATNV